MNTLIRRLRTEREAILQMLNRLPSANVQRAADLLGKMQQAERLRLALYEHYPKAFDQAAHEFKDPKVEQLHVEFLDVLHKIREGLNAYRWTPTMTQGIALFDSLEEGFELPKKPRDEYWENFLVLLFWKETTGGRGKYPAPILLFRRCQQCEKWFFATKDHQKYCRDNCRQQFAAKNPAFKERRAGYMREYRKQWGA